MGEKEHVTSLDEFAFDVAQNDFMVNLGLFRDLDEQRIALDVIRKEIDAKLEVLSSIIQDKFIEDGIQNMSIRGRTVYLNKQLWAGKVDDTVENLAVTNVLVELGLGNMVTFNTQSLSSYVREVAKSHPEMTDKKGNIIATPDDIVAVLPEPLNTLLKVTEKISVRSRKA
jgi:hypothetical protein